MRLITEVDIPAPPEIVWQVLTDFEQVPDWNPSIIEIVGKAELGAKLNMKVYAPNGSGISYGFKATIINWELEKQLAWKGGIPGLLLGVHFWQLSPNNTGTHLVHGEDFSGLYPLLMGEKRIMLMRPAYEAMNLGLVERVVSQINRK